MVKLDVHMHAALMLFDFVATYISVSGVCIYGGRTTTLLTQVANVEICAFYSKLKVARRS